MQLKTLSDLKSIIEKEVLPKLTPKTVVLLIGEMGVGKTQFVRTFCEAISAVVDVSSPTFSIINEYDSDLGVLHHVDLYRIESEGELFNTGFREIFEKEKGLIFIEWPEKMNLKLITKDWKVLTVKLSLDKDTRDIQIS